MIPASEYYYLNTFLFVICCLLIIHFYTDCVTVIWRDRNKNAIRVWNARQARFIFLSWNETREEDSYTRRRTSAAMCKAEKVHTEVIKKTLNIAVTQDTYQCSSNLSAWMFPRVWACASMPITVCVSECARATVRSDLLLFSYFLLN